MKRSRMIVQKYWHNIKGTDIRMLQLFWVTFVAILRWITRIARAYGKTYLTLTYKDWRTSYVGLSNENLEVAFTVQQFWQCFFLCCHTWEICHPLDLGIPHRLQWRKILDLNWITTFSGRVGDTYLLVLHPKSFKCFLRYLWEKKGIFWYYNESKELYNVSIHIHKD